MIDPAAQRTFSSKKHASGAWRSRDIPVRFRPLRAILNYISFKRSGVDHLARKCKKYFRVLDCGSGSGAYSSWFLDRCACTIIALDWSPVALKRIASPRHGIVWRVCADACAMPFKPEFVDAAFTIDTLGHVENLSRAADELLRVVKPGAPLFIHSECGDYRERWPDRMLIRRIDHDTLAELDGHISLCSSNELHILFGKRFLLQRSFSPAGIAGWLLGYPEKYSLVFARAHCRQLATLAKVAAALKRSPLTGVMLRILNAITNHCELFFCLSGGGSFFAELHKPVRSSSQPEHKR